MFKKYSLVLSWSLLTSQRDIVFVWSWNLFLELLLFTLTIRSLWVLWTLIRWWTISLFIILLNSIISLLSFIFIIIVWIISATIASNWPWIVWNNIFRSSWSCFHRFWTILWAFARLAVSTCRPTSLSTWWFPILYKFFMDIIDLVDCLSKGYRIKLVSNQSENK